MDLPRFAQSCAIGVGAGARLCHKEGVKWALFWGVLA
jgi:hypothetical protein